VTPAGEVLVHLYGGEPLTNLPAMSAIVGRALEKSPGRFVFGITTNGTVLSDEVLELLDQGRFDVTLSVDGPAPIHDAYRCTRGGDPTHGDVLEFLREVQNRTRCTVRGSAVVRPGWGLADACEYLRRLDVDTIKAQVVRVPPGSEFELSPTERRQYCRDLGLLAQRVIEDLEAGVVPKDGRFTPQVLQLLAGIPQRTAYCDAGRTSFGVLPSGDVVPCVLIRPMEPILGHVNGDPWVWLEEGRRWRDSRELRPECAECDQLPLCGGGCPAITPICGKGECEFTRRCCELSSDIHRHFEDRLEDLLGLVGIV
jgi:uncharacterized protein